MRYGYTLLVLSLLTASGTHAQTWCIPSTAQPYSPNMPGITRFALNTIDRQSADLENYPDNSYVNTGLSTTLVPGNTYTVTMSFTVDASICPDMNLRVWIDYNQDGTLDGSGETVISADNQLPGTFTGTFTVPMTATPGTTRLRATAKMTSNGGHELPTPCDVPPDPLGYHGELEDYDITIASAAGVAGYAEGITIFEIVPNAGAANNIDIRYNLRAPARIRVALNDVAGNEVAVLAQHERQEAGAHTVELAAERRDLAPGMYFVSLTAGAKKCVQRVLVTE